MENEAYLHRAHFFRMAFVVKEDEAFDPIGVGFLGLVAHSAQTDRRADLIEEFGRIGLIVGHD